MSGQELRLRVNGKTERVRRAPDRPLLFALRNDLGLKGTKYGCGEGQCGACTVLVDGSPVHSCQVHVSEVVGKDVTTIEGLADGRRLSPVQRAFAEMGAFQCGYCTPGMIVRATALLATNRSPTRDEIASALEGNLCRCCGYVRILRAVERAADLARAEAERP
jgi:aerobic-type carbon monoxide dehydrogenase small subunit (CoxS/CutS family)